MPGSSAVRLRPAKKQAELINMKVLFVAMLIRRRSLTTPHRTLSLYSRRPLVDFQFQKKQFDVQSSQFRVVMALNLSIDNPYLQGGLEARRVNASLAPPLSRVHPENTSCQKTEASSLEHRKEFLQTISAYLELSRCTQTQSSSLSCIPTATSSKASSAAKPPARMTIWRASKCHLVEKCEFSHHHSISVFQACWVQRESSVVVWCGDLHLCVQPSQDRQSYPFCWVRCRVSSGISKRRE